MCCEKMSKQGKHRTNLLWFWARLGSLCAENLIQKTNVRMNSQTARACHVCFGMIRRLCRHVLCDCLLIAVVCCSVVASLLIRPLVWFRLVWVCFWFGLLVCFCVCFVCVVVLFCVVFVLSGFVLSVLSWFGCLFVCLFIWRPPLLLPCCCCWSQTTQTRVAKL